MITKRQRIFLILFGLIVIPLLFEIILRTAGYIYYSFRIKNEVSYSNDKDAIRILCVGDSFTFGIGAPKGYSYPEQLERMLNEDGTALEFVVYNAAVPGSNSSQLAKHFDEYIDKFNPHIVVVMTGCNNKEIPRESNYYLFENKGLRTYLYKLDYFLENNSRSYKLLKVVIGKIEDSIRSNRAKKKNALFASERKITDNSEEYEALIKLGQDYFDERELALAQEAFQNAVVLNPDDERGYLGLANIFMHGFHQYELGIEALDKALKINPDNLEALDLLWSVNYKLGRNEAAKKVIEKYVFLHPEDEMNLSYFLSRGLPDINDDETFDKLLRYDLENIIKSAKKMNIKIILQGYHGFKGNKIIEDTAFKLGIPFVDNESAFKKLTANDWRNSNYFAEDGHFNANGYRVIAENLCKVIKSEIESLQ